MSPSPAKDALGAFVPGIDAIRDGASAGPLAGLSFAAKDIFDVAGVVTGCGNPDWAATHAAAAEDAWAVARLLPAGARLESNALCWATSTNGRSGWRPSLLVQAHGPLKKSRPRRCAK